MLSDMAQIFKNFDFLLDSEFPKSWEQIEEKRKILHAIIDFMNLKLGNTIENKVYLIIKMVN